MLQNVLHWLTQLYEKKTSNMAAKQRDKHSREEYPMKWSCGNKYPWNNVSCRLCKILHRPLHRQRALHNRVHRCITKQDGSFNCVWRYDQKKKYNRLRGWFRFWSVVWNLALVSISSLHFTQSWSPVCILALAPVVRRLDNAIHRINRYPVDKC